LRKIEVSDLIVGDVLDRGVYAPDFQLVLIKGAKVTAEDRHRLLMREFPHLITAATTGVTAPADEPVDMDALGAALGEKRGDLQKLANAGPVLSPQTYTQAKEVLSTFYEPERPQGVKALKELERLAGILVSEVTANIGAAYKEVSAEDPNDYLVWHSVHVAVLLLLAMRGEATDKAALEKIALAALVHNVGMTLVPHDVVTKKGPLTREEFAMVKHHPMQGAAIVSERWDVPENLLTMIEAHHERVDGLGYPHGLRENEVSRLALMLSACDVFDALASTRPYRERLPLPSASLALIEEGVSSFGLRTLNSFIRAIGVYPVGSTVALDGGDAAVVIAPGRDDLTRPTVAVVMDRNRRWLDPPQKIDLTLDAHRRIVGVIDT